MRIEHTEHCTLYLGDCLEVLPTLGKVDAVVTDPPYGIGRDGKPPSTSSHGGHKGYEFLGWDAKPADLTFIVDMQRPAIVWGGNYFSDVLPPSGSWLVWDKGQKLDQADAELAWSNLAMPVRTTVINRVELMKDGAVHPTQKPLRLIAWCLSFLPDAETIFDPFMGSGTTGVACVRTGRRFIGIEKEPKYFEIALNRIRDAERLAKCDLFKERKPAKQQGVLV